MTSLLRVLASACRFCYFCWINWYRESYYLDIIISGFIYYSMTFSSDEKANYYGLDNDLNIILFGRL